MKRLCLRQRFTRGGRLPEWRSKRRAGITLLEVILAIGILGGAMAAIGELIRIGSRSGAASRDMTRAQILCESKMAELSAGIEPLQSISSMPLDALDGTNEWSYSTTIEATDREGLLYVGVTVTKVVQSTAKPVFCSMARWMLDPELEMELLAAGMAMEESVAFEEEEDATSLE